MTMIHKIDQDGNGTMEFEEFADFMATVEKSSMSSLEAVFKVIDKNGNGRLDKDELQALLFTLGEVPTTEQMEYMMRAAGTNDIDFNKFVELMNCNF